MTHFEGRIWDLIVSVPDHCLSFYFAQTNAHMTSICSSDSGSETSPTLLKLSQFSAQISGFSADFHRKSLDIVKQHPDNAEIWADSVF